MRRAFERFRGRVLRRKASGDPDPHDATPEAEALRQRREAARREQDELRRRRDALAQQVSKEHWDLGGLAYEMAVRDHFRLDVLVRRAAVLQEHDMELAELQRKLQAPGGESTATPGGPPSGSAEATALAAAAGSAAGGASVAGASAPEGGTSPPAPDTGPPKGMALRVSGPLWMWVFLLPGFLGFGVLAGWASGGSGPSGGAGSPVRVALAEGSAPNGAPAGSSTPGASTSSAPEAESSAASEASSTPATSVASIAPVSPAARSPRIIEEVSPADTSGASGASGPAGAATKLPPIKHVFVVMLSNQPYASVFGPESKASYLVHSLEGKGKLLERYYAVTHEELANEVALVSGQGPTPQTATNCPSYTAITPATGGAFGQVLGQGCVYPHSAATLGAQLAAKHLAWRVYLESMGSSTSGDPGGCQHPVLGANDPTAVPGAATPYATFRDPFLYFESVTGASTCAEDNVALTRLRADLANENRTPAFSYIVPDLCHDASPTPCAAGQQAGPADADGFLKSVVGQILDSAAYRKDGLLVITTDEAPATGEYADSSSCCGQPRFPNVPASTSPTGLPRGGGEVGALLLSPYIKGGTVESSAYNSFSLLRTIEDFFGLTHLGYASLAAVSSLAPSLFTAAPSG